MFLKSLGSMQNLYKILIYLTVSLTLGYIGANSVFITAAAATKPPFKMI